MFLDSKALTASKREELFREIKSCGLVGWILRVISAKEISGCMLQKAPKNLNTISFEAAINLIIKAQEAGVNVTKIYVDTVGDPVRYEEMLTNRFQSKIEITVRKKADSLFKCVSAASICAKVTRDLAMEQWSFSQSKLKSIKTSDLGSGYPADERTQKWLQENCHPIFGYSDLIRFSWSTTTELLKERSINIKWPHEEKEEDKNQQALTAFFAPQANIYMYVYINHRITRNTKLDYISLTLPPFLLGTIPESHGCRTLSFYPLLFIISPYPLTKHDFIKSLTTILCYPVVV